MNRGVFSVTKKYPHSLKFRRTKGGEKMKFNSIQIANAFAFAALIFFVACRVLVSLSPDLMFSVAQSWFHGIELSKLNTWNLSTETFLIGLISSAATAWIFGFLLGLGLEIFGKKK